MIKEEIKKLLNAAWEDGLNSFHDTKTRKQYDEDWNNFLNNYEYDINQLANQKQEVECDADNEKEYLEKNMPTDEEIKDACKQMRIYP